MLWFTSDLHLGHANALKFTDRPYPDIDAMNRGLIANINARVAPTDHLYVLGDFSFRVPRDTARDLRQRIRCRNVHLIPGNHDKDWTQPEVANTFIVEPPICQLKALPGQKLVLCHYPIADWPALSHGSIHLHGHIHAGPDYNEAMRQRGLFRYDVGVDANALCPVSLSQVQAFFEGVEPRERVRWQEWGQ